MTPKKNPPIAQGVSLKSSLEVKLIFFGLKFFGRNHFWLKKILLEKLFSRQFFRPQRIFGRKNIRPKNDLDEKKYSDFAMSWIDQGASIVGGCCEIGPSHIFELSKRISNAGFEIV